MNGGYDNSKLENDSYENSALDRTNGFAYGNWSEYNARNYNVGANATFRAIDTDTTSLAILVGAEAQKFESDGFGFNLRDSEGPAYAMPALRDSLFGLHDSLYDAVSTVTNAYVNQYRTDGFLNVCTGQLQPEGPLLLPGHRTGGWFVPIWTKQPIWFLPFRSSRLGGQRRALLQLKETISFLKFRTSWGRTGKRQHRRLQPLRLVQRPNPGRDLRGRHHCLPHTTWQP